MISRIISRIHSDVNGIWWKIFFRIFFIFCFVIGVSFYLLEHHYACPVTFCFLVIAILLLVLVPSFFAKYI